jgi:hypothetical protein
MIKNDVLYTIGRWRILEDWKIKISVLWLFAAVAFLAHGMLELLEPNGISQVMSGEMGGMTITPELLLLLAVCVLVPLVMAFLSLTLKDSINRWANIIVGLVFAALWCVDVVDAVEKLSASATLITLSTVVALALIVWYAWKSKQKA